MRLVQQLEGAYVRRMRRAVPKPGRPCTICGQAKRVRIEARVTAGTSMTLGGSVGGERAGEHLHQPVGRPGELAKAGNAARLGHAGQAEIESFGQQPRHQDAAVGRDLAGTQRTVYAPSTLKPDMRATAKAL